MGNQILFDKSSWQKVRFDDVAKQKKTSVNKRVLGQRYVAGEHMVSGELKIKSWGEIDDGYLGPAFNRLFEEGDILYGSRRTYLRKVAVADFSGITSNTTFVLNPIQDKIYASLLPYLMLSKRFTEHSVKNSKGSVNPYINWKDIAKYEFLLPNNSDQQKISNFIDTCNELINRYDEEVNSLRSVFESNLECLIPKDSDGRTIGKDISLTRGISYTSKDLSTNKNDHALVNLKCFERRGGFNPSGIKYYKGKYKDEDLLQPGDLIVAATDLTRNGDVVGYPVLVPDLNRELLFTMDAIKITINSPSIDTLYFYYLLRTKWAHWHLFSHSSGSTVLHLDSTALHKLRIPDTSTEQQIAISDKLSRIEATILAVKRQKDETIKVLNTYCDEVFS